jgi:hypothetical protein
MVSFFFYRYKAGFAHASAAGQLRQIVADQLSCAACGFI